MASMKNASVLGNAINLTGAVCPELWTLASGSQLGCRLNSGGRMRMLKQARLLTRPTLADISPSPLSLPRQPLHPGTRLLPSEAAGDDRTGGVVSGYVEDCVEPRTKLGVCFSIRLELVFCYAVPQRIAGDLEEPACFGNVAACALQRFF